METSPQTTRTYRQYAVSGRYVRPTDTERTSRQHSPRPFSLTLSVDPAIAQDTVPISDIEIPAILSFARSSYHRVELTESLISQLLQSLTHHWTLQFSADGLSMFYDCRSDRVTAHDGELPCQYRPVHVLEKTGGELALGKASTAGAVAWLSPQQLSDFTTALETLLSPSRDTLDLSRPYKLASDGVKDRVSQTQLSSTPAPGGG